MSFVAPNSLINSSQKGLSSGFKDTCRTELQHSCVAADAWIMSKAFKPMVCGIIYLWRMLRAAISLSKRNAMSEQKRKQILRNFRWN